MSLLLTDQLTVALAGGGTGGHVMPALAVGRELLKQRPNVRLIYIGNKDSLEERLAESASIEFFSVSIKPLRRGVLLPNLKVPLLAGLSVLEARKILADNRVKIVFGSGGFSSWPACAAARVWKIPYFLTDGNAYPGLVTRLLGRRSGRIYITFPETANYFSGGKGKTLLTGFPISDRIGALSHREALELLGLDADRKTILVTGGSGGARSINQTIAKVKESLLEKGFNLIWQTGKLWDATSEISVGMSGRLIVEKFLEPPRMAAAISASDLAITRCGIMTLSELAAAGLPAILIPFPFSAEGHQEANARAIQDGGGGVMIRDGDLNSEILLQQIDQIIDSERLLTMKAGMKNFSKPDAAKQIVSDMLEIAGA